MKQHKPNRKKNSFKVHGKHDRKVIYNEKKKQVSKLYHTKKWQALRAKVIAKYPICDCGKDAKVVDHVIAHEGNESLFYDESNLKSCCSSCHNRKTALNDVKRDENGKIIRKYD